MGYEELIRDLQREAGLRRESVLAAAREEARRIIEDASQQCDRLEKEFQYAMARDLERERTRMLNRAQQEARMLRARVRSELVREVFARLEETLKAVASGERYPSVLAMLLKEALPEGPEGEIVIRADAGTRALLQPLLKGRAARFEPIETTGSGEDPYGGFELSDREGTIVIRNTFRSRLEKARPNLLVELNRALFGEFPAGPGA